MRFTRARYSNRVPSPRDRRRACLCDDGRTYSTKCCEGGFQNQGIGSLSGGESSIIIPPEVEALFHLHHQLLLTTINIAFLNVLEADFITFLLL